VKASGFPQARPRAEPARRLAQRDAIAPRARSRKPTGGVRSFGVVVIALGLHAVVAGCGADDDDGPTPAPRPKPAGAATPGPGGSSGKPPLAEKLHIEDRVGCPIPDKPTDPKGGACDPKGPSCAEHLYCLPLAQGAFCEPCPERDGIRHVFRDRDFATEQNRDPFQSNLLPQLSTSKSPDVLPIDPTKRCLRKDQMVATTYSYAELKLVGIVAQGTQRKVLMMGGSLGYIIKRGDCVGKEKALVKDIGAGYITFLVEPDPSAPSPRGAEEYSVQLNPRQLATNEAPGAPSGSPPASPPTRAASPPLDPPPAGAGSANPGAPGAPPAASPPGLPRKP
jgi:hypothetical protein